MPPRRSEDTTSVVRGLLRPHCVQGAKVLVDATPSSQLLWTHKGHIWLGGERGPLLAHAALRLLEAHSATAAAAAPGAPLPCAFLLVAGSLETAATAAQLQLQQLDAGLQVPPEAYEHSAPGLSHSDASFDTEAEPAFAACSGEKVFVTFNTQLPSSQGSWRLQVEMKHSDFFNIIWQQLQQPVGFTVLSQATTTGGGGGSKVATACRADAAIEAGGARRLFDLTGLGEASGVHKTVKLSGQDFTVKLRQGAVAPTQRGAVTRYCTLDTAGTMVQLYKLEKLARVYAGGNVTAASAQDVQALLAAVMPLPAGFVPMQQQQGQPAAPALGALPQPAALLPTHLPPVPHVLPPQQMMLLHTHGLQWQQAAAAAAAAALGATPAVAAAAAPAASAASSGDIAGLQAAQAATEDAVDLLGERSDRHECRISKLEVSMSRVSLQQAAPGAGEGMEGEEEVSSALGKRPRQAGVAIPGAASAAVAAAAPPQPPAQPPRGGVVLPPPAELRCWLLELLWEQPQEMRELCRQLVSTRLQGQLSCISQITKMANAELYGLEREGRCARAEPAPGSARPRWVLRSA